MAEYIDIDAQVVVTDTRGCEHETTVRHIFEMNKGVYTAADVRPVARAAWQSWEQDKPPCKWYSCDYCGFHALSKSNYCPNCGAKMIGGEDDV